MVADALVSCIKSSTDKEERVPPDIQRSSSRDHSAQDESPDSNRQGRTLTRKADEIHCKQVEYHNLSAREKRRLQEMQKKTSSADRHIPILLRPVGYSSKGEAFHVLPTIPERAPSPALRQRMSLLKAQKHKTASSSGGNADKQEAAQKRRDELLAEKKGTNRKKGIRLPDQYTSTVMDPYKLAKDGEAYTVSLKTPARARSPSPSVHERLSKPKAKEPDVMAAEQAQKMAASTERRNVYLKAKKKQQRLKSEELARLCRERAAQIEASEVAKDKDQDTIHIKSLRGRALSPDQEEASFRQFARDLTEKLGLSEAPLPDYLAKEVDTLKDAPVGVPGYPKKGGVSSGTSLLGNLPPMVPAPRKTHSLVTNVKASWWVENRNKQMGYRPSLRETLPPLLPPRDKTISAARGDAPEGRAARATEPTSHQAAKEDPDLYQTEITKQPSRGPKLDRNTQEELVIESCDETDDDVSLLELCTPRSDALEDFEEDDDDDLETLILDDDEPMSLSPTPTPTPTPMVPLPSPSSLTKPMSDTDLEGKRKMFLPKLLRNLKPCWMKKKQKIQPAPYPVQDEEIDNKKIAGNTMAEKTSAPDKSIPTRLRAWFARKAQTAKPCFSKPENKPKKPPKPYKISKIKAIRIVDGEVQELDAGKKGLRKLVCWK